MSERNVSELYYRIPGRPGGQRPGAHRGLVMGPGTEFATHARLFDMPDPRRIDLNASLRRTPRQWLVRASRQKSASTITLLLDVSRSMHFGSGQSKLQVIADFVQSLGHSAYRSGDLLSMTLFDQQRRDDLHAPARQGRGVGSALADTLRNLPTPPLLSARQNFLFPEFGDMLCSCTEQISNNSKLIFLVSDFHWPDSAIEAIMDRLESKCVVPLIVWDKAETEPPGKGGWLNTRGLENGERRSVWLRASVREQWRDKVRLRRQSLSQVFASFQSKPFFMEAGFDAESLSRYFLERA